MTPKEQLEAYIEEKLKHEWIIENISREQEDDIAADKIPIDKSSKERKKRKKKRIVIKESINDAFDLLARYNEKKRALQRNTYLKSTYGIDENDFIDKLKEQNNRCALCETESPYLTNRDGDFLVDHCHRTNRVRGLLCAGCNNALGGFEKLLPHMSRVLKYLNLNLKLVSEDAWLPSTEK